MYYFGSPNNVGQDPPLVTKGFLHSGVNAKVRNYKFIVSGFIFISCRKSNPSEAFTIYFYFIDLIFFL